MVWADAGCACADADTAIGLSPLPCDALVLGGPPAIIVVAKTSTGGIGGERNVERRAGMSRVPYSERHSGSRHTDACGSMPQSRFSSPEGSPDEPRLQRHRRRWSHPGAARSLG